LFGGDGGPFRFIIGNPNYLEGLGGPSGPDPPLLRFDGYPTKIIFTSLGIYVCTFTSSIPFGV
jgi:hypothetical protein